MNRRRTVLPLLAVGFCLAQSATARYVYVLPANQQAGALTGFNQDGISLNNVNVPAGLLNVFTAPAGDKAILISTDTGTPVSFVSIVSGQFSGAARSVSLNNVGAKLATISSDGKTLLVATGTTPGRLYLIDIATEVVLTPTGIPISNTMADVASSPDGAYAYVLSNPGILTVVSVSSGTVVSPSPISIGGSYNAISISPIGRVLITGLNVLWEYNGASPFDLKAVTQLPSGLSPGKLQFTPDGKWAVARNQSGTSVSAVVFNTQASGSNSLGEPPSYAVQSVAILKTADDPTTVQVPDKIFIKSNSEALVYLNASHSFYTTPLPLLNFEPASLGSLGQVSNAADAVVTNEFPFPRTLFYNKVSGGIQRYDFGGVAPTIGFLAAPGPLVYSAYASTGPVATFSVLNGGQTVDPSATLEPYVIRVTDANDRPVWNALLQFSSDTAGTGMSVISARSNLDGLVILTVTAPPTAGTFAITVTADSVNTTIPSTVRGTSGGDSGGTGTGPRIIKESGDGQILAVGSVPLKPWVAKVVDADGNPIVGRAYSWNTSTTETIFFSPTVGTTDSNGEVSMTWYAGQPQNVGFANADYRGTLTVDGIGSITFYGVGYQVISGSFDSSPVIYVNKPTLEQPTITAKVGTAVTGAIQVTVISGGFNFGQAVANAGLTASTAYTDPTQGPVAKCKGGTTLTGADGNGSCDVIATGKIGTTTLTLNIGDFRYFQYPLVVTAGDPAAPTIVNAASNNQVGKTGALLPIPLIVEINDGYGNVLPGTAVTWTVVTPGSVTLVNPTTVADANGRAQTSVRLGSNPGTFQITVTAGGKSTTFTVQAVSTATAMNIVSGNNQTDVVTGTAFQPLVVKVTDAQENAVVGQTVTWTKVSGDATLSATTSVTGADGTASVTVTAGTTAGAIVITASSGSLPTKTFNLSSRLPAPSITAASFTNYTGNVTGRIAAGALVKITGPGIASSLTGQVWATTTVLNPKLPITLAGITVQFTWAGGQEYAPIQAVANDGTSQWVLVQVPFGLQGSTTADCTVDVNGGAKTVTGIPVDPYMPGILEYNYDATTKLAIAFGGDGRLITPVTPAHPNESVTIYTIGMGQTAPVAMVTNQPGIPNQMVKGLVKLGVGTAAFDPDEVRGAENLIGIYMIKFKIPATATAGTTNLGLFIRDTQVSTPYVANSSQIVIGN
jgi:uncharacterized protein (TIGR03437 family)